VLRGSICCKNASPSKEGNKFEEELEEARDQGGRDLQYVEDTEDTTLMWKLD
jgi:hypothetical protein